MMQQFAKDSVSASIIHGLKIAGYPEDTIVKEYDYMANGSHQLADIVAFSNPYRKDIASSCIAVEFCDTTSHDEVRRKIETLKFTAAPIGFFPNRQSLKIIPLSQSRSTGRIVEIEHAQIGEYLQSNRIAFLPETIQAFKMEGRQLSLFQLDPSLYEYVSSITKKELVTRFEKSFFEGREHLGKIKTISDEDISALIKVAIRLLTARVLEDKRELDNAPGRQPSDEALTLLKKASQKFSGYFQWKELTVIGKGTANIILDSLGRDITFRTVTSEQLGYFYEHCFVNKDIRQQSGIYYTPHKIALDMLKSLPIESIPYDQRNVFDGTCGSGGLLVASYNRMNDLLPKKWSEEQKHAYLRSHISGIDIDPFATEIAKKSLLLSSLPIGDSWVVNTEDFLKTNIENLISHPNIIVANPPFKETREDHIIQKATLFLDKYLSFLSDGGLISIVLPESYIQNPSCRESRKKLLGAIEILEMKQLPEGLFPMANCATVIISGKKRNTGTHLQPIRVRRLLKMKKTHDSIHPEIQYDVSYIWNDINLCINSSDSIINISPFKILWDKLRRFSVLGDYFEIKNGVKTDNLDLLKTKEPGSYKYLSSSSCINPHVINWSSQEYKYIRYPGASSRPRKDLFEKEILQSKGRKVLINSGRNPTNPWRIKAAIDRIGCIPNETLDLIFPIERDAPNLEILAAVLNSYISNIFIDSFIRTRRLNTGIFKKIPFPELLKKDQDIITKTVNSIEDITQGFKLQSSMNYDKSLSKAYELIDSIIFRAFGLDDKDVQCLKSYMEGFDRPGYPSIASDNFVVKIEPESEMRRITGKIFEVYPEKNTMKLGLFGNGTMDAPIEVQIPDSLPGWALKGCVGFEASVPINQNYPVEEYILLAKEFKLFRDDFLTDIEIENYFLKRSL